MMQRRTTAPLLTAVAAVLTVGTPVRAQDAFVAPQAGWSELRRAVVGGQAGVRLLGGLEVAAEGLVFFPEEPRSSVRDIHLSRSAWQANANLLYAFDRSRRLILYVGVGASYAQNRRSVVVDGVRSRLSVTGWAPQALAGARLPYGGLHPFMEWRSELGRERQWVVTGGVRLPLPGG